MIHPEPIVKSAENVQAGDVVFWPKSRNKDMWWRHVDFVSHQGVSPNRKTTLHFSSYVSQEYSPNESVIVGFKEEAEWEEDE